SGSQRYPIGWGGDPQSDWEGLAASIRGGLSWGMSGNPYHSSDIGGFYGAEQPSPELYVRWLQAAVFASHIRLHGIGEREPWAFGADMEAVARKWLAFRYRLIPYLERVVDEAAALEALWIFGKPAATLTGFTQASIDASGDGSFGVHASPEINVEIFGDGANVSIVR